MAKLPYRPSLLGDSWTTPKPPPEREPMLDLASNPSVVAITNYLRHRTNKDLPEIARGVNRPPHAIAPVLREMQRARMVTASRLPRTRTLLYNLRQP
jgi:hypothetical protein